MWTEVKNVDHVITAAQFNTMVRDNLVPQKVRRLQPTLKRLLVVLGLPFVVAGGILGVFLWPVTWVLTGRSLGDWVDNWIEEVIIGFLGWPHR